MYRKPLDRNAAHACLWINLLALPGLGSFLAGRWRTGVIQAGLALAGLGLIVWWIYRFVLAWINTLSFPVHNGPSWLVGAVGVVLTFAAWFWALATSLAIVAQTKNEST